MRNRWRPVVLVLCSALLPFLLVALAPDMLGAGTKITVPGTYQTLADALAAAQPGQAIEVRQAIAEAGLYMNGKSDITIVGKGITIDSLGSGNGLNLSSCQRIEISGFTFTAAGANGISLSDCVDVTISGCVFVSPPLNAIASNSCSGVTVTGCTMNGGQNGIQDVGSDHYLVTKCTFSGISGRGVLFSLNGAAGGTDDSSVTKCTFDSIDGEGIRVCGTNVLVSGNALRGIGQVGVAVDPSSDAAGVVISKNRITGTGLEGVVARFDTRVEKNTVTEAGGAGIRSYDNGAHLIGNKVYDAGGHGIAIDGSVTEVSKNTVTGSGVHGVFWRGSGGWLVKNKVTGSKQAGLYLEGTGNEISGNTFLDSGGGFSDLHSMRELTENTFEKNKYETSYFLPPK